MGARELALLATTTAMLAALVYVLTAAGKMYWMKTFANVSRDLIWMSPLANLVWYVVIGWSMLALIALVIGERRGFNFGVWSLGLVFIFSLFLRFTAIHRLSALIFSAGLAMVLLRIFQRAPDAWLRRARYARNGLALAFLAATAWVLIGSRLEHRRTVRALPEPAAGKPNVILVIVDAMRGDVLQTAGYGRRAAPFLDSLAGTGAQFTYAFATAPWTLPSHGTMFTGRYPSRLNATFTEPLDESFPTVAEAFGANGYYNVGFTANLHYTSWESGLDRGFAEWHDFRRSFSQLLRSSELGQLQMILEMLDTPTLPGILRAIGRRQIYVHPKPESHIANAEKSTDRFLSWFDRKPARPFFAFINYYDAHWSYTPPAEYQKRFSESPSLRDLYDGEIAFVDDELRRLFTELRNRGGLENTYVIITSDHGELFGEHNLTTHGNSLYAPAVRVPLIIVGPGIPPARIERAVTLRDLPSTMTQLVGIESTFPGVSLTGHLADSSFQSSPVLAWHGGDPDSWKMVLDDEFHLVRKGELDRLYRYRSDVVEANDLAGIPEFEPHLLRLRSALEQAQAPPRP